MDYNTATSWTHGVPLRKIYTVYCCTVSMKDYNMVLCFSLHSYLYNWKLHLLCVVHVYNWNLEKGIILKKKGNWCFLEILKDRNVMGRA